MLFNYYLVSLQKWETVSCQTLKVIILKKNPLILKAFLLIFISYLFQKRVLDTFPKPIDAWAKNEAHKALKTKKKSVLVLPFDKVHSLLKEVLHSNRLDDQVSLYLVAVLDYIAGDILKV